MHSFPNLASSIACHMWSQKLCAFPQCIVLPPHCSWHSTLDVNPYKISVRLHAPGSILCSLHMDQDHYRLSLLVNCVLLSSLLHPFKPRASRTLQHHECNIQHSHFMACSKSVLLQYSFSYCPTNAQSWAARRSLQTKTTSDVHHIILAACTRFLSPPHSLAPLIPRACKWLTA